MKGLYDFYKKHRDLINLGFNLINLLLVLIVISHIFMNKDALEEFSANTIDFSALKNLGDIAKGLNSPSGTYTMPGNLIINGTLQVNEKIICKDDINFEDGVHKWRFGLMKAAHVNGASHTGPGNMTMGVVKEGATWGDTDRYRWPKNGDFRTHIDDVHSNVQMYY